jgi:membrane protease YdiL (CAAX protease family)
MLPEKPWKLDAVLRLFAGVLICAVFIGAFAGSAIDFFQQPEHSNRILDLAILGGGVLLTGGALALLARPWALDAFPRNAVLLLLCFNGALLLSWEAVRLGGGEPGAAPSLPRVLATLLGVQAVSLVLVRRFVREHGMGWATAFDLAQGRQRALWLGAGAALLFVPAGWGLQLGSELIMERVRLQPEEQVAVQVLRGGEGLPGRLALGAAAILVAPVIEEMLFRGILYPAIKRLGHRQLAWWGSALAFGAVHLNLATFVPLTALALVLTWLYERADNLLAPIAAHSVFNAMNFALLWYEQSRPPASG